MMSDRSDAMDYHMESNIIYIRDYIHTYRFEHSNITAFEMKEPIVSFCWTLFDIICIPFP